jgi:hypothetical protein
MMYKHDTHKNNEFVNLGLLEHNNISKNLEWCLEVNGTKGYMID